MGKDDYRTFCHWRPSILIIPSPGKSESCPPKKIQGHGNLETTEILRPRNSENKTWDRTLRKFGKQNLRPHPMEIRKTKPLEIPTETPRNSENKTHGNYTPCHQLTPGVRNKTSWEFGEIFTQCHTLRHGWYTKLRWQILNEKSLFKHRNKTISKL